MMICTLHIYNNYSNYSFQSQIISIVIGLHHGEELTLRATQLSGDVKPVVMLSRMCAAPYKLHVT